MAKPLDCRDLRLYSCKARLLLTGVHVTWCHICAHIADGNRRILSRYIDALARVEVEFDPERRHRLEAKLCMLTEERVRWAELRKEHILESCHASQWFTPPG